MNYDSFGEGYLVMDIKATQAQILAELAPRATSYLEVGVQEGRSFQWVVEHGPDLALAVLCDTWGDVSGGSNRGSHDHILPLIPADLEVRFLDGDSRETLPTLTNDLQFDLVHIDGGHSYEVALSDLRHGWRLCADTMVVHDITFPEVWRAFSEFAAEVEAAHVRVCFGGHGTAIVKRR